MSRGVTDGPPGALPAGLDRDGLLDAARDGTRTVPDGATVVVALSGGPDSSALAHLLAEARPDLDLQLVHVRHGLRDDTADRAVVAQHADWLGLPLTVAETEVVTDGAGPQAAARAARYATLRRVAEQVGATVIALGHTADDQAETVLFRAARGTGTAGLAAMRPRRGDLLRPLLRVRRADLEAHLAGDGLPSVADPSNADLAARRVRVRARALPALGEVGPDPVGALTRLADLAADDEDALRAAAATAAAEAVAVGSSRSLPVEVLAPLPVAVRRRVTLALLADLGGQGADAAALQAVEELTSGRRQQLPGGLEASVGGGWRTVARTAAEPHGAVALPLPATGDDRVTWPPGSIRFEVRARPDGHGSDPRGQTSLDLDVGWVPSAPAARLLASLPGGHAERCHLAIDDLGPLWARHRQDGDRIRTRAGTVRVGRLATDAGVPVAVRDRWPVVVDRDDRVVWVPGLAVDEAVLRAGRADARWQLLVGPDRGRS